MTDNPPKANNDAAEPATNKTAVMSLSALKRNPISSAAQADAYRELLAHPNQKPGMPPHGTRRSMGKR